MLSFQCRICNDVRVPKATSTRTAAAARETGVAFADLSYLFEATSATIYYDICHYHQEGNEMLARAIAEHLARELGSDLPDPQGSTARWSGS